MKIKLILAASPEDPLLGREPFMPLSLPLLAASAPDHEYQMVDMLAGKPPRWLEDPADLVGISMRATGETEAYRLAETFRARGVPVVLGGPQASAVPMRALEHADAVAVGEGEPLWPVIVEHAAAGELRRLYVCGEHHDLDPADHAIYRVDAPPDLAGLPRARRDLMPGRYTFDTILATRGCPIDCDFCSVPDLFGRRLRARPAAEVAAEIHTFGPFYYLLDDTVFGRPGSHGYYLELYEAVGALPRPRLWMGQANLDALAHPRGREVVEAAVKAGLIYAAVGLESVDPEVLKLTGAASKMGGGDAPILDRIRAHVRALQDLGVIVSGWFTIGYPQDSVETYRRTFAFCEEMNILPVISPVRALAGTRLHRRLVREGGLAAPDAITNVPHPTLDRVAVVAELRGGVDRAYAAGAILRRTAFYRRRWAALPGVGAELTVRRNVFALLLQLNTGRILRAENENLARGYQDLIPLDPE